MLSSEVSGALSSVREKQKERLVHTPHGFSYSCWLNVCFVAALKHSRISMLATRPHLYAGNHGTCENTTSQRDRQRQIGKDDDHQVLPEKASFPKHQRQIGNDEDHRQILPWGMTPEDRQRQIGNDAEVRQGQDGNDADHRHVP